MPKIKIRNMPHIKATLKSDCKIIHEDYNTLIVYNKCANAHLAEGYANTIINKIKNLKMECLETTNKEVFDYFYKAGNFKYHQICVQCHHKTSTGISRLYLPSSQEMQWIAKVQGMSVDEIAQISADNRIFVYKEKGKAVSCIGIHIDGSVGFLYTRPKYRQRGYAVKAQNELFKMKKEPIFSQILEDNSASIALHKKNGWKFNRYKIYWLFNKGF